MAAGRGRPPSLSSSVPSAGPPPPALRPLLPKVSLLLTCRKFLEMLPFVFRSNLPTGGCPVAKEIGTARLIFPCSPRQGAPALPPAPSHPQDRGGLSLGSDTGEHGPRGRALHEVWVATAVAPVDSRVPMTLPGVPGPPVATACQVFPCPPAPPPSPRAMPMPLTPGWALAC